MIKNTGAFNDEVDFNKIFKTIYNYKNFIFGLSSIFLLLGIVYSLFLPNIYQSRALLSPVNSQTNLQGSLRGYGGIASLAGINIPSSDVSNNSVQAIEKIKSLSFFKDNIMPNIYLPDLMAFKSWDPVTKEVKYNSKDYDVKNKSWTRDIKKYGSSIPSAQESYEIFIDKHLNVVVDQEIGFIEILVNHQSPYISNEWTNLIVSEINSFYRQKDEIEAISTIDYLSKEILATTVAEIRVMISELIQKEMQKLSVLKVNNFYVYEFIDPPEVMEEKYKPSRVLISFIFMLFGCFLGIFISLVSNANKKD
jgi:LPS O-antigen subunit length determinant protein (WzzB/FepE family)